MAPREKKEDLLIINRRTGKALQCTGTENGSVVVQAAVNGSDAQLWTPVKMGRSAVKLLNKLSGKVLDVTHGSTEAGAWAQVWDDVADGDSQLWQLKGTITYKKLINIQSGKVLDIVDMREDDGAPAQLWDDVDGAGQQWKLAESRTGEEAREEPAPVEEEKPAPKRRGRRPKAAEEAAPAAAPAAPAEAETPVEPAPAPEPEAVPAPKAKAPAPAKRGRKPAAKKPGKRGRGSKA